MTGIRQPLDEHGTNGQTATLYADTEAGILAEIERLDREAARTHHLRELLRWSDWLLNRAEVLNREQAVPGHRSAAELEQTPIGNRLRHDLKEWAEALVPLAETRSEWRAVRKFLERGSLVPQEAVDAIFEGQEILLRLSEPHFHPRNADGEGCDDDLEEAAAQ